MVDLVSVRTRIRVREDDFSRRGLDGRPDGDRTDAAHQRVAGERLDAFAARRSEELAERVFASGLSFPERDSVRDEEAMAFRAAERRRELLAEVDAAVARGAGRAPRHDSGRVVGQARSGFRRLG